MLKGTVECDWLLGIYLNLFRALVTQPIIPRVNLFMISAVKQHILGRIFHHGGHYITRNQTD
jgi:hypothetical protein